jgi:endonuclease YncB( thermonuclease family)
VRGWLPGLLVAAGVVVFLIWGSLAKTESAPRLDRRSSTVLASGIVASVTDGDTIRLADNRRIRLVQIDAPERPPGECYAERAATALNRLAPVGTAVSLRLDRALDPRDEHGRVLAYVTAGNKIFNLELVEMGAAAPYFFQGRRGRYAEDLMRAALRAKAAGRGLWGHCPSTNLDPNRAVNARK